MRLVFIGCVQFSAVALEHVLALAACEVAGIVTKRNSAVNADFVSLAGIADQNRIPCINADETEQDDVVAWIKGKGPDVIYCFGWSNLLQSDILTIAPLGVVGYHPAALPRNRGRHPIIWTLALGLKQTASTFFFMDQGADSGDILSQVFIDVLPQDTAKSLYDKLTEQALVQIERFSGDLAANDYKRIPQDDSQANYWRKRFKPDGVIDWRMSAKSIYNLVRALSRPYVGAHCECKDGSEAKVWQTAIVDETDCLDNLEPGKVVAIEGQTLTVKCGEGLIRIVEHEMMVLPKVGDYL